MLIKAIGKLLAVIVTIFIILHEFPELGKDIDFLGLLMTWGMYAVFVFWIDYRQAKEKPTGEKLDELLKEFKGMREDLIKLRLEPTHIGRPKRVRTHKPVTPKLSKQVLVQQTRGGDIAYSHRRVRGTKLIGRIGRGR